MVKVSVVIPVFNVENYLNECLDSIVNQTLKDIEIICVNDGSTDSSLDILNNYAKKDNRIKIISQKNQGQAVARNNGMEYINGEYFCFMDADDILDLNTLETCYNISKEKSLDFVMYKLINFDDNGNVYTTPGYDMYVVAQRVKDNVFNYRTLGELIFNVTVSPANKLFNTEFIKNTNVKFPEGTIFEDNLFFWRIFFQAEKLFFIDEYYYKRRVHGNSTTGSGNERWIDAIEIYNRVWDIFKEFGHFDEFKIRLYNNKITFALFRLDNIKYEYKELFFQKLKNDLNHVNNYFIDFSENLHAENKRLFELILFSDNYEEFNLMRNLTSFSEEILELDKIILNIYGNLSDIFNKISINISDIEKEKENLQLENNDLKKQIEYLSKENEKVENELKVSNNKLKKYQKLSESLLSSNSWKVTKPLRITKRKVIKK